MFIDVGFALPFLLLGAAFRYKSLVDVEAYGQVLHTKYFTIRKIHRARIRRTFHRLRLT